MHKLVWWHDTFVYVDGAWAWCSMGMMHGHAWRVCFLCGELHVASDVTRDEWCDTWQQHSCGSHYSEETALCFWTHLLAEK